MKLGRYFFRQWVKLRRKIVSEKATPGYIARGWAVGMFYGCFAPIGTQLIFSIPTAFALKGSKIGAVFGTLLTNHFTIWFIYPAQCWFGSHLLGRTLEYETVKAAMKDVLRDQSFTALMDISEDLFESFLLGGFIMAVVLTPITYYFVKRLVIRYREQPNRRHKIKELVKKLTGTPENK